MFRVIAISLFIMVSIPNQGCSEENQPSSVPISHSEWDALLKAYVNSNGDVNYQGFAQDSVRLQGYLDDLSANPPGAGWPEADQLAYWINTYNAFTVKLIADNYPVASIKDLGPRLNIPVVNTVWHKKFFEIGGKPSSLDEIEHKILRKKFREPRIHFAIVCASASCPVLRNEAFTSDKLEAQLQDQTIRFINDEFRNKISASHPSLSRIFLWFRGDFTRDMKLIDYLNQYSEVQINPKAKISYLPYDWSLNERKDTPKPESK